MATTPNYGWPVPVATDYVKNGYEAIADLGDAIDATVFALPAAGLTLISATTVGTTVASVTVSNCFNATYNNYKITYSNGTASAVTNFNFKGSGVTGSPYLASGDWTSSSGTTGSMDSAGNSVFQIGVTTTVNLTTEIDVFNPFAAANTALMARTTGYSTIVYQALAMAVDTQTNSSTGFTLSPLSGTLTGGTIRVYGYQNS